MVSGVAELASRLLAVGIQAFSCLAGWRLRWSPIFIASREQNSGTILLRHLQSLRPAEPHPNWESKPSSLGPRAVNHQPLTAGG